MFPFSRIPLELVMTHMMPFFTLSDTIVFFPLFRHVFHVQISQHPTMEENMYSQILDIFTTEKNRLVMFFSQKLLFVYKNLVEIPDHDIPSLDIVHFYLRVSDDFDTIVCHSDHVDETETHANTHVKIYDKHDMMIYVNKEPDTTKRDTCFQKIKKMIDEEVECEYQSSVHKLVHQLNFIRRVFLLKKTRVRYMAYRDIHQPRRLVCHVKS